MKRPILKKKNRPVLKKKEAPSPPSPKASASPKPSAAPITGERALPWRQLLASVSGKQQPGESLILEAHNLEGDLTVRVVRAEVGGNDVLMIKLLDSTGGNKEWAVAAFPAAEARKKLRRGLRDE